MKAMVQPGTECTGLPKSTKRTWEGAPPIPNRGKTIWGSPVLKCSQCLTYIQEICYPPGDRPPLWVKSDKHGVFACDGGKAPDRPSASHLLISSGSAQVGDELHLPCDSARQRDR
jgi:hypothetical protein